MKVTRTTTRKTHLLADTDRWAVGGSNAAGTTMMGIHIHSETGPISIQFTPEEWIDLVQRGTRVLRQLTKGS